MLGFIHPRPQQRKEVAMQVVRQEARHVDSHTLTVDVPAGPDVVLPSALAAIRFEVTYTLAEYLAFLRDHLAFLLPRATSAARRRRVLVPLAGVALGALAAWLVGPGMARTALAAGAMLALACLPATAGAWVALVGTPVFFVKKRRIGRCTFRIDAHGIERTSRAGTLVRGWADVTGVRRYRRGYLLTFARGAMPIPYRCLDLRQEEALRRLAARAGRR